MWLYLLQGTGYGFSAAAQPGPFQAYLISQTLARGWRHAFPAAFAPLVSDGPIIALCVLVLSQVPQWLQRGLYLAGGCFLLYLALGAYWNWRRYDLGIPAASAEAGRGLLRAALMNALSPGPYIYWTLVTGPILLRGWRESPAMGLSFLLGFYVSIVLSLLLIVAVFSASRQLGPRLNRAMLGVSVLALLGFGAYQIWQGIRLP
ncbi:MAG TPA: LysE family transporter [Anaerolineales bacterium]